MYLPHPVLIISSRATLLYRTYWQMINSMLYSESEQQADLVNSHPTPTLRHLISEATRQLMVLVLETARTKVSS